MFCAPRHVFDGTEGVGSRSHVLHAGTRFRRNKGRRLLFSCFFVPGLVFGGTKGVGSRFLILRARCHFRRYRGHRVPFSCFVIPGKFSAVRKATCLNIMFCAPGFIFDGSDGVGSRFHVLRAQIHFQRYGGQRFQFSYFTRPDLFSAVPSASGPVVRCSPPGHVLGGAETVGSRFHILRSWTLFRRYRGRRVLFSYFARQESFSAEPRASAAVIMICAPELIFGGTEAVGLVFMFCEPELIFSGTEGVLPVFMFCAPRDVFGGAECVESSFLVLCSRTRFRRYRGRRFPFSCLSRSPGLVSAVPRATGPIFMFCASGLIYGGTVGVGSHFHVLRAWTHFRRYQGRRFPFSCFARPDSFSAVSRASSEVFIFYAP
jgi:hypothetical protein